MVLCKRGAPDLRNTVAKKKRISKADLDAIERAAKREAQKAAGALDGRFRSRVIKNKKKYTRKQPPPPLAEE